MSYELYITRADGWPETVHWSESGCNAIAFDEWEELIKADPELAIDYSDRLTTDELERLVNDSPALEGCRTADGFLFSKEQVRHLKELAEALKRDSKPVPEALLLVRAREHIRQKSRRGDPR
jgi:hypothetical protein